MSPPDQCRDVPDMRAPVGRSAAGPALAPCLQRLADRPPAEQYERGYGHTLREICQQPATWGTTAQRMVDCAPRLEAFLDESGIRRGHGALVLTGSGSSLYVGACAAPRLQVSLRIPVHVVAGGDLLTHLPAALPPTRPCVVVSFGRSGDSPESTAVVNQLLAFEPDCRHLFVTCCPTGRLATLYADDPRTFSIVLDEATCDRSLVMTSSFTNMVVAAESMGMLHAPEAIMARVSALRCAAEHLLASDAQSIARLAEREMRSAMVLASGSRFGAAREVSLKLTEMTAGGLLSCAETYLGLRHGPMSAVRPDTLVLCFLSSDPTARAYEIDLIEELKRKGLAAAKLLVGENVPRDLASGDDVVVEYAGTKDLGDEGMAVLDVVVGQLLAFFCCLHLELHPDSPSASGIINRVVEPFTIYSRN